MATYRALEAYTGPATAESDASAINLGLEFSVSEDVQANAVFWHQAPTGGSSTARTVGIYPATGTATLLGTGVAAPVGSGWQRVALDAPIDLAPGSYKAVVFHPDGKYPATGSWFLADSLGGVQPGNVDIVVGGILTVPTGIHASAYRDQGLFAVDSVLARPDNSFNDTSYWVDVEISTIDAPLAAPDGAVDSIVPATVGNDDGSVTISWDDVPTATRYEVGIADGHDQTSFTVVESNATSPYTIEDLAAADYTVGVRAVRE
jgi:hypothetical protein